MSSPCGQDAHGFLWENGGPIVDLNTLVSQDSGIAIIDAFQINDAGEIAGHGILPSGDLHAIVLIPCDEHHPGECDDYSLIDATDSQPPSLAEKGTSLQAGKSAAGTAHRAQRSTRATRLKRISPVASRRDAGRIEWDRGRRFFGYRNVWTSVSGAGNLAGHSSKGSRTGEEC